jgi:hypothetical protein
MPAIGFGLTWAGYTLGMWGYCLVRGFNITLSDLANPVHILNWQKAIRETVPQGQILPGRAPAATTTGKSGKTPPAQAV